MTMTVTDANFATLQESTPSLGMGGSRTVYDLGDAVLKVDMDYIATQGIDIIGSCATEVGVWQTIDAADEHHFATILAYGNGWLVMEKLNTDIDRDEWETYMATKGLEMAYRYDVDDDVHMGNYGQRDDGTFAMLDYGCTKETMRQGRENRAAVNAAIDAAMATLDARNATVTAATAVMTAATFNDAIAVDDADAAEEAQWLNRVDAAAIRDNVDLSEPYCERHDLFNCWYCA